VAVRRGLANIAIQAYLTAAAVNLKRLAAAFSCASRVLGRPVDPAYRLTVRREASTLTVCPPRKFEAA